MDELVDCQDQMTSTYKDSVMGVTFAWDDLGGVG